MRIPAELKAYSKTVCRACINAAHTNGVCETHCSHCGSDAIGEESLDKTPLSITQWDPRVGADLLIGLYCPKCGQALKALLAIG